MRRQVARTRARHWTFNALACLVTAIIVIAVFLALTQASIVIWSAFAVLAAAGLVGVVFVSIGRRQYDEMSFKTIPARDPRLLAPPALLPEATHTDEVVLAAAKPPVFDPSGKELAGQFIRHGLPELCMVCLTPTTRLHSSKTKVTVSILSVPCCDTCAKSLSRRRWGVTLGTLALLLGAACGATALLSLDGLVIGLVAIFAGIPILLVSVKLGERAGRPLGVRDLEVYRGWSAIRPRNSTVAAHLAEFYSRPELYSISCRREFLHEFD